MNVSPRLGGEFDQALRAAEIIGPTFVLGVMRRLFGNCHAADRVLQVRGARDRRRMLVSMFIPLQMVMGVRMRIGRRFGV